MCIEMTALETKIQPLPHEQSLYMQQTATRAVQALQRFSGGQIEYGATSLQLLDEWIDRLERKGSLSAAERALVIAFVGQTFLETHGGFWAKRPDGQGTDLGVVCPVTGPGDQVRFISVVDQVNQRLDRGINASLAYFYLTTSVGLQGRF
jgi:hypothetical protein